LIPQQLHQWRTFRNRFILTNCGENAFDIEHLADLVVLPHGMSQQQLVQSNDHRRTMRANERQLRLNVFCALLKIFEDINSPVRTIEYVLNFTYHTRNYGLEILHLNEVGAASTGRGQPRFTQIVNAISLICKLCSKVEITFDIWVQDVNDYNQFQFTHFQDRIIKFLDVQSTQRNLSNTVTLQFFFLNNAGVAQLRETIARQLTDSSSKFPNFRYAPWEAMHLTFQRRIVSETLVQ
jgi:hypothetical protein